MNRRVVFINLLIILSFVLTSQAVSSGSGKSQNQQQEKTPPNAMINPGSLDFSNQVVKKPSASKRITVTNTGEKPLYINSVVLSGEQASDFTLKNDTCTGANVATQKSCVIDVVFAPAAVGSRKAELVITDNAVDSPQKVMLTGIGINSVRVPPDGSSNSGSF